MFQHIKLRLHPPFEGPLNGAVSCIVHIVSRGLVEFQWSGRHHHSSLVHKVSYVDFFSKIKIYLFKLEFTSTFESSLFVRNQRRNQSTKFHPLWSISHGCRVLEDLCDILFLILVSKCSSSKSSWIYYLILRNFTIYAYTQTHEGFIKLLKMNLRYFYFLNLQRVWHLVQYHNQPTLVLIPLSIDILSDE